jgi:hypothetical protein
MRKEAVIFGLFSYKRRRESECDRFFFANTSPVCPKNQEDGNRTAAYRSHAPHTHPSTQQARNKKPDIAVRLEKALAYAENEVPQPQPPVAFGFSNVNPEPIMFDV